MKTVKELVRNSVPQYHSLEVAVLESGNDALEESCPACLGMGYLADPDGRAVPCDCASAISRARLWRLSGLVEDERSWQLAYLERPGKEVAVAAARRIVDTGAAGRPVGWLSLFGAYGVGKSGILKASVAALILLGVPAVYRRAEDVLDEARRTFSEDVDEATRDRSAASVRARYAQVPFLALDEVDRVSASPWARSFLFALLDERYNRRGSSATMIATNQTIGAMGDEWGYLESRMSDGLITPVEGEALRG